MALSAMRPGAPASRLRALHGHLARDAAGGRRRLLLRACTHRASTSGASGSSGDSPAADDDDTPCVVLTNDDGPPDAAVSPYVGVLAPLLAGWVGQQRLLTCLPSQQQSWRGKAHFPYEELHRLPYPDPDAPPHWATVSGSPAAAANFALTTLGPTHFPQGSRPFVVSGPNHGDNAGRSYMLSSGTLGAAMEAAILGYRSVAVSFQPSEQVRATEGLSHSAEEIETACRVSVRLLKRLWAEWPAGVDLFNVNVPLGRLERYRDGNNVLITTAAIDSFGGLFHEVEGTDGQRFSFGDRR